MRFAFMRRYEDVFRIRTMCRVLSVTPQGYYAWKKRPPSTRAVANEALLVEIRASHLRSKRSYGSPRVWRELKRRRGRLGETRVARLMARDGLRPKRSKRYRITTDSRNTAVVHENVLARDFTVGAPGRAWAGDITYLWTREGWLYLAVVLDIGPAIGGDWLVVAGDITDDIGEVRTGHGLGGTTDHARIDLPL